MDFSVDNDDVVEAIREDDDLMGAITENLVDRMEEPIRSEVREAFDYHHDHFRMSWVRMMESELNDLTASSRDGRDGSSIACDHGQKVYDGIFHAIREYIGGEGNNAVKEMLGIGDNLVATLTELINDAVEQAVSARINSVWQGSGYTIDTRPIKGRLGEPVPVGKPYVSPTHYDDDVRPFSTGDTVLCDQENEPHQYSSECTNPRRAEDEFGNPLVSSITDE